MLVDHTRQELLGLAEVEQPFNEQLLPPALRTSSDFEPGESVTYYDRSLRCWHQARIIGKSEYNPDFVEVSHAGTIHVITFLSPQHLLLWRTTEEEYLCQPAGSGHFTPAYHLLRLHIYLAPQTSTYDRVAFENHFNKRRTTPRN